MDERLRWAVAVVAIAALIGLVLLARGQPDHGGLGVMPPPVVRIPAG